MHSRKPEEAIRRRTVQAKGVLLQDANVGGHEVSVTLELECRVCSLDMTRSHSPAGRSRKRADSGAPPTPGIVGGEPADQTGYPYWHVCSPGTTSIGRDNRPVEARSEGDQSWLRSRTHQQKAPHGTEMEARWHRIRRSLGEPIPITCVS